MEVLVLPLLDIIENVENDSEQAEKLRSLLSSFEPAHGNVDEKTFLSEKAIFFEKHAKARTYLVMLDCNLGGFFSIAIKSIELRGLSKARKKLLTAGDSSGDSASAFLIGHLARSIQSPDGFGAKILDLAFSFIYQARRFVGGRIAYLDCKDIKDLREYYEGKGFRSLQKSPNTGLLQYYIVL